MPHQAVVVAKSRRADLQDRFRPLRIVPKHLRPLDTRIDLLDQRLDPRRRRRQSLPPVLRIVHPGPVVFQILDRPRYHTLRIILKRGSNLSR